MTGSQVRILFAAPAFFDLKLIPVVEPPAAVDTTIAALMHSLPDPGHAPDRAFSFNLS
jgi:hypothetical protein